MLSDLRALAGDIGPRGTGTPGEEAAAEFVAGRLTALGLPVERQTFRAVASQNTFPLVIDLMALCAVAIYPLAGTASRWVAAGLALTTAPLLWSTIRTSGGPLRLLLARVNSHNVVSWIEPEGELIQHAVILAHLDTNRCRLAWQSRSAQYLEPLTYLTLGMLASLGGLYLAGALLGGPGWVWWASLLPAAYVSGTVVTLWLDDRTPYSPGAHDNAAGMAVALEIGARLVAQRLARTRVWLAFTGAEETDHAGLYTLLRQGGPVLRDAAFIGLEGPGSGEIVYLSRQGLCAHYRPDPRLLTLADRVAARRPELGVRAAQMTMEDEVGTLRRAGYRALCIAGRDPATGTLPHWHRADDTVDSIADQALERAAAFVLAILRELDENPLTEGEGACAPL